MLASSLRVFVLVSLAALGSSGCDPYYRVCGNVTACTGVPLVGVHVTLRDARGEMMNGYTDPAGRYCGSEMGSTPPDSYQVTYEKPGFKSEQRTVTGEAEEMPAICMSPLSCSKGEQRACACADGGTGVETCLADGSAFGPCESCASTAAG